ncbi:MAG: ABC transporter ATP-binding protein [Rhodospirillales bacterium]
MIEVRNLVKRFGGFTAVDGCSLTVETGSLTGLIGPNGAGKTTLFNTIAGTYRPDGGQVLLDGADVGGMPPHVLFRRGLVRTFQIPHEFARMPGTENQCVPVPGQSGENLFAAWFGWGRIAREEAAIRKRALEVLEFLNLSHVADHQAGRLSGGQKKLVEIGRAIMSGAKTILLDEPAAGVNRALLGTLTEDIRRLHRQGYTFLLIEHDMDMIAALCDPIYVMAEGKVLAQGTMAEIRADARVREAYLGHGMSADGATGAAARAGRA